MEFSKRLRELRRAAAMSQAALGQKLFVSKMCVSHWEKGDSEPSIAQLNLIASIFRVSVDYLVCRTDE